MKILVISQGLGSKRGGAESSLLTLINHLAKSNELTILNTERSTQPRPPLQPTVCYHPVIHPPREGSKWLKTLQRLVDYIDTVRFIEKQARPLERKCAPDLIICQKPPFPYASTLSPVCTFVRDLEYITYFNPSPCRSAEGMAHKLAQQFIGYWILRRLRKSTLVISNSNYTKSILNGFGVASVAVSPFVALPPIPKCAPNREKAVLFICATLGQHKGIHIFTQLALALPSVRFIAVGQDQQGFASGFPPNVEWHPWLDDTSGAYQRASILVVPSQLPETFGRVVIEAQAHGIPVLASQAGALPETVGLGGCAISPPDDVNAWIQELTTLLADEQRYATLSSAARANAEQYSLSAVLAQCDAALLEFFSPPQH